MKKTGFIDTHTHPYKEYYDNPEQAVEQWHNDGVDIMFFVGTSLEENHEVQELTEKFDYLYPIYGIHPNYAKGYENAQKLRKFIDDKTIAIGEVGLDFHYRNNPSREVQIETFKAQIEMAKEFDLPVMIHCREAYKEVYETISAKEYKDVRFTIHTYSGDEEWAKKFLKLGCYFSFSGVVTFKNAKDVQAAAKLIPLDRIFSETDSPFLCPHPFRGKCNNSTMVKLVVEKLAELKEVDVETLKTQIYDNVKRFFKI